MKKISKLFKAIFLTCLLSVAGSNLFAQGPTAPPADPSFPNGGTPTNAPVGGGAPTGSGVALLISLAVAYGAISLYLVKRKKEEGLPADSSD